MENCFSIRDLLWLTLVVATGLGWAVREQRFSIRRQSLAQEGEAQAGRAKSWRHRTGALEELFRGMGWTVYWELESSEVVACPSEDQHRFRLHVASTTGFEPSVRDD